MPRIMVAFHSFGTAPTQFALDLSKAMRYSGTIIPGAIHEQSCYVDAARNKLVRTFLSTDCTHMMMVDVDLSFESDAFLKTFTVLQATQADIVYGNYSLGNGANSIFGPPENAAKEAAVRVALKPNCVYEDIATGGTGWLMASREVLQRMQQECPGPWHWFARDPTADGKDLRGEDISFGLRAWGMKPRPRIVGITTVLLRHLKYQGMFPNFMSEAAAQQGSSSGVCIPNPFESDPKRYYIFGNSVVDKDGLTKEQRAAIEEQQAKDLEEAANAGRARAGVESSRSQEGPEQEAHGGLRVWNAEEDRLEAEKRAGLEPPGEEGELSDGLRGADSSGATQGESAAAAVCSPGEGERGQLGSEPAGAGSPGPEISESPSTDSAA